MPYAHTVSLSQQRQQIDEIRRFLEHDGNLDTRIPGSAWNTSEHLDHTIKVAVATLQVLSKPRHEPLPRGINVVGRLVLWTGWIPRGRGKSPEKLRGAVVTGEELSTQLTAWNALIDQFGEPANPEKAVFRHPFFGGLTVREALRFLVVHTHHHLKMVRTVKR